MKKRNKIFIISVIVLILILSIGAWFVADKLNRIDYTDSSDNLAGENVSTEESIVEDTVDSAGEAGEEEEIVLVTEEEMEALGLTEAKITDMDIFSDSDVFNVLLLGTDERKQNFSANARADSIMILSIDKENKTMKLVSLQRGMGVPILEGPYKGQYDWITHCFRYGGAELVLKEVRECLRVDVNRYVRVNFDSFADIIDTVGGVDIELTSLEAQGLNGEVRTNAYAKHKMYEGMNHLDGYDALQYSRLRYIDSDWKRIERQRNVIQAVDFEANATILKEFLYGE